MIQVHDGNPRFTGCIQSSTKTNAPYTLAQNGVHPTEFGHSKIADAIFEVLD